MTATAVILTCDRDRQLAEMLADAVDRVWPGVTPQILHDTDTSTETDIPGDIRDVVRQVPYLRKVFDAWKIAPTDDVYILDSDCLLYQTPTDFPIGAYQPAPGYADDPDAVDVCKCVGLGYTITKPCFVAGMLSANKSMWVGREELCYEYVRECVRRGFHKEKYPGVVCEQGLQAGLWRTHYPDNPLDPNRYPINTIVPDPVLWHISGMKGDYYTDHVIEEYRRRFCDR